MSNYLLLSFSILFEVIGTSFMKVTDGFTNFIPSMIVIVCYGISLSLYVIITRTSEIGIINAIWSGGGTIVIIFSGLLLFHESLTLVKMLGTACIILGVVGLNIPVHQAHSTRRG